MADYTKVGGVAAADIVKIDGVAIAGITKVSGVTKPSGASITWTDSLWDETNLQSDLGDWSDGSSKRFFGPDDGAEPRANMDLTVVPFIDNSVSPKLLKCMCPLMMGLQSIYRFLEVDEGTRVEVNGGTNPDAAAKSDTGVEIDSATGDLVDGEHVVKVGYKRVPAKGSTLYRRTTVVVKVVSNVMTAYSKSTNSTSSTVPYYSAVSTIGSPFRIDWEFTYTPATNTWANSGSPTDSGLWNTTHPASGMTTGPDSSGNGCEKAYSTYYVDADTGEHRIWYFKTG